jgi:hypothetical protein
VIKYLKGSKELGIVFHRIPDYDPKKTMTYLEAMSDSDFAGEIKGRKSTTGNIISLGGGALWWRSQTQRLCALSTAEAEYIALASLVREVKYLRRLLGEIHGVDLSRSTTEVAVLGQVDCRCDNQSALKMAETDILTQRTKYIDVRAAFIKGAVDSGEIKLSYVPSGENKADSLTKALPANRAQQGVM